MQIWIYRKIDGWMYGWMDGYLAMRFGVDWIEVGSNYGQRFAIKYYHSTTELVFKALCSVKCNILQTYGNNRIFIESIWL